MFYEPKHTHAGLYYKVGFSVSMFVLEHMLQTTPLLCEHSHNQTEEH